MSESYKRLRKFTEIRSANYRSRAGVIETVHEYVGPDAVAHDLTEHDLEQLVAEHAALAAEVKQLRAQTREEIERRSYSVTHAKVCEEKCDEALAEVEQLRSARTFLDGQVFVAGWYAHAEACASLGRDARETAWRKYREEMSKTLAKAESAPQQPEYFVDECDCDCQLGQPCLCPERDCYCGPCRVCGENPQQPEGDVCGARIPAAIAERVGQDPATTCVLKPNHPRPEHEDGDGLSWLGPQR